MTNRGWIGFDLDGTLAIYTSWQGPTHIGEPIQPMIDKVKQLLATGAEVRIFTARVCSQCDEAEKTQAIKAIEDWCIKYIGQKLPITAEKDWNLIEYYDDRAIGIIYNTGQIKGA